MTTIPKGARKDFFTNESSPGPAHYSPKLSFVSK